MSRDNAYYQFYKDAPSKLEGEGGGEPSLENNPLTVRDVSNGNPALRREKWKAMSFEQ